MNQHTGTTHHIEAVRPLVSSFVEERDCLFNDETESEWRAVTLADAPHYNEIKEDSSAGRPAAPTYLHHYYKLSNPITSLFLIMPILSSQ